MKRLRRLVPALLLTTAPDALAQAQTFSAARFVNGITISGDVLDASPEMHRVRLGFFSDLAYDAARREWWGLSDRGPGGGVLSFETRAHRFTVDINQVTGRISNFRLLQTIRFRDGQNALNGRAPDPRSVLGQSFDPEGLAIIPSTGHLLVADEYGPSLIEFDRSGTLVRRFTMPPNIIPRNRQSDVPNFASDEGNDAGRVINRGFESLAIGHDGRTAYALLENGMLDEGGGDGHISRMIEFDLNTGTAIRQFAYPLQQPAKSRGVSALVAIGPQEFLVLERDTRGVGVGATLAPVDKAVVAIDIRNATDISALTLKNGVVPPDVTPVRKLGTVIDLDANTLRALGAKSPQKWEGLAIGPRLRNGDVLVLASTDNDFSVTQTGSGTQYDVWFNFQAADPMAASITCPIGQKSSCVSTATQSPQSLTSRHALLPGVLHAYRARLATTTPSRTPPTPNRVLK